MPNRRIKPTHVPGPDDFDYDTLLASIRQCRDLIVQYRSACGSQSPLRNESDVLLAHMDAFALLTPVPGALEKINPQTHPTTKC